MNPNSISVFCEATKFGENQVESVMRLNGANSVWLVNSPSGPHRVMKYFERHAHGHSHYETEAELWRLNGNVDFLSIYEEDSEQSEWISFRFIQNDVLSQVSFSEVLKTVQNQIRSLKPPSSTHSGFPGILGWWKSSTRKSLPPRCRKRRAKKRKAS